MEIKPIAFFHCDKISPIEAARQGSIDLASQDSLGEVRFLEGFQFEQALEDIQGFSHLWLLYQFHHNSDWKPKVMPPRGTDSKKGIFATRSPYRPNALGLSCVELVSVKDLSLFVKNFDLLNGSPIFDVKPYLAYSDSFPEASMGWLADVQQENFNVFFLEKAEKQIQFLEAHGLSVKNILIQQLSFDPLNKQKKRVKISAQDLATFSYKTWRFVFQVDGKSIQVLEVHSGYSPSELSNPEDPYCDKDLHRKFNSQS